MSGPKQRLRRHAVTSAEWMRHRKLLKKIASARWYAKKKKREIQEQRQKRQQLEAERRQREAVARGLLWPDTIQSATWYAVAAHHARGYPVLPRGQCPLQWRSWCERIDEALRDLRRKTARCEPTLVAGLDDPRTLKVLRQLAIRECRHGGWLDNCDPPAGLPPPYPFWTTSVWGWIWVLTHLTGITDRFPDIWQTVRRRARDPPPPPATGWRDEWHLLHTLPHICNLLYWMSTAHTIPWLLESDDSGASTTTPPQQDREEPEDIAWHTQPPTPSRLHQWYYDDTSTSTITDTDTNHDTQSESLPSSLDIYLQNEFNDQPQYPGHEGSHSGNRHTGATQVVECLAEANAHPSPDGSIRRGSQQCVSIRCAGEPSDPP